MTLTVALAAALMAADPAPLTTSPMDAGYPPYRYRGDGLAWPVHFVTDVNPLCGEDPPNGTLLACQRGPMLVLPNPCSVEFAGERFAKLACHELGHLNGWPGNHPRP